MLTYPEINPVALQVGPLAIHWYGLMYLLGFIAGWALLFYRAKDSRFGLKPEHVSDIAFYAMLGVIIGGRLGYMFFYHQDVLHHPLRIFALWQGGMSFHGGLLGVVVALWLYARKINKSLGELADFIAPVVPIGLGAGRIGNFINGELWGRVTDMPWGMIFPTGGELPRHPSQLYEFFLEGIVLFSVLWFFSRKERPRWAVSGLFLLLYGLFRFIIEFFREPDSQMGFVALGWMSEGQLLSIPMIFIGTTLLSYAYVRKKICSNI